MIINKKLINENWIKYFIQTNFILFVLIFAANTISSLLRSNVTSTEIALNQLFTMPDIWLKTIPVSCLLTNIILTNKLIKTSELTALYSIGFSPLQITLSILKLSTASALLVFAINGFLKPKLIQYKSKNYTYLEEKFRKLKKQGLISSKIANGKMWYRSNNYFFNYSTYDERNNVLKKVELFMINKNKIKSSIFSKSVENINDTWLDKNLLEVIDIDQNEFTANQIKRNLKNINIPISQNELKNLEEDILSLNIFRFRRYINQLDRDGVNSTRYKVNFWQKISVAISCVIFSFIGLLGLNNSNKRSQSMGASIGLTFIIIIIYWFLDSFFIELGKNSKINTLLSTFGALLITVVFISLTRLRQIIKNY